MILYSECLNLVCAGARLQRVGLSTAQDCLVISLINNAILQGLATPALVPIREAFFEKHVKCRINRKLHSTHGGFPWSKSLIVMPTIWLGDGASTSTKVLKSYLHQLVLQSSRFSWPLWSATSIEQRHQLHCHNSIAFGFKFLSVRKDISWREVYKLALRKENVADLWYSSTNMKFKNSFTKFLIIGLLTARLAPLPAPLRGSSYSAAKTWEFLSAQVAV